MSKHVGFSFDITDAFEPINGMIDKHLGGKNGINLLKADQVLSSCLSWLKGQVHQYSLVIRHEQASKEFQHLGFELIRTTQKTEK